MEEYQCEDIQSCMALLAFPVDTGGSGGISPSPRVLGGQLYCDHHRQIHTSVVERRITIGVITVLLLLLLLFTMN